MNGILMIDKDRGMTSRDVVNQVGKILHTKKVGHTGTLDPMATGVLILCVGSYTKLVNLFIAKEKTYVAKMKLGIQTDTGDITGSVIKRGKSTFPKEEINKCFSNFYKEYEQTVPIYSAVKVNGKKLYEYAREGKNIELPKRLVRIFELKVISIEADEIEFETTVSKGTYIRSLIEDLAASLGTVGTMTSLRRIKQGNILIDDCISLDEVKEGIKLKQIEDIFNYPRYNINDDYYQRVKNGNTLKLDSNEERLFLVYEDKIAAVYEKNGDVYKILFSCI